MLQIRRFTRNWLLPLVALCALGLGGCASNGKQITTTQDDDYLASERDPWETYNRAMFRFNDKLDRNLVKPVAKGYRKVVPTPVRRGIGNFFRNLYEPTTIINDLLQGKFRQAGSDTGRFLLNSTLGLLGFIDVASDIGLERHVEDFGQTLAVWGIEPGPHLVLPLFGPSNIRDGLGLLPYYLYTDPRAALDDNLLILGLNGLEAVDNRAQLLATGRVIQLQLDPYVFVRESYRQRRLNQIYDGDPPLTDEQP